jgi:hypothetical protein
METPETILAVKRECRWLRYGAGGAAQRGDAALASARVSPLAT